MIIRSQDGTRIVNFANMLQIMVNYTTVGVLLPSGSVHDLGKYDSIEKALKVLDKLEDSYCKKINYFRMPQNEDV